MEPPVMSSTDFPHQEPDTDRWFIDWFQEDYLLLYRHRDAVEAQGFLDRILPELHLKPSGRILDLACGAGRHAIYLASKGHYVFGLDRSMPLLVRASASDSTLKIPWVQGDMRSIPIRDNSQSAVFNMFTSFGYFLDDRDNAVVLQEVSRILTPGGWLILDTLNPSHVEATLVPRSHCQQNDLYIVEERNIDHDTHRVNKTISIERKGKTKKFVESVRMYSVNELHSFLESEHLTPKILWGDYQGSEYHSQSPRIIIAATAHGENTL